MEPEEKIQAMDADRKKRRILWVSVGLLALFLIVIWGFSFKSRLVNANWDESSERQIIEKLNRDWQETNELINRPLEEKRAAEQEVKSKLMQFTSKNENTSSTVSENSSTTENNVITSTNQ